MADEIITGRIVFDDKALQKTMDVGGGGSGNGFVDALTKTALAQDSPIWGDIAAGLGGIVLAAEALVKVTMAGFQKLVDASPHLQATMDLISKTLKITLRPMADTISMFLRPLAISWLRFVLPVYKSWRQWFGEGGGLEARIEIGKGFEKIKEGVFELDFEKIKEGFVETGSAFIDLFKSFGDEVLGPQLAKFYEWWGRLQEAFGTSGVFDTIFTVIKEGVSWALGNAWDFVKGLIGDTKWGNLTIGLSEGLWGMFTQFTENLKSFVWAGPLAPFFAAIETGWSEIVSPMVDMLIETLDEKIPGLRSALEFMFSGNEELSQKSFLGEWIDNATEWDNIVVNTINPLFGLIYTTAETMLGKNENDKGNNVIGSLNATQTSMNNSVDATQHLIDRLDLIPKNITTTHTIITKRKVVDI